MKKLEGLFGLKLGEVFDETKFEVTKKEFLHGDRSLKHRRHGHGWQGIALIAAAFIIILLHIAAAYYFLYL
mgnify:CR=1 FL=1